MRAGLAIVFVIVFWFACGWKGNIFREEMMGML